MTKDLRVKISDPSRQIVGGSTLGDVSNIASVVGSIFGGTVGNIANAFSGARALDRAPLAPLSATNNKVVFPYTPEITVSHQANYTSQNPTHSNYEYLFYQNSQISEITINAMFTAKTPADARYVLAVQHFFRIATKMFYGQDALKGLPPVVCRLEGYGNLQFNYVPVVVTNFTSTLPSDVDYISTVGADGLAEGIGGIFDSNPSKVPTMQTMTVSLKPLYSRNRITNDFSLSGFANGSLLSNAASKGGFI